MSRLLIATIVLVSAALLAEASVLPPVPRIPSSALKPSKPDDSSGESLSSDKLAERVQQNTKAAADRLADSDPGAETRQKQDQALKDLDALLKQAQNPPPMSGQSGGQSDQQQDQSSQNSQQKQGSGSPMSSPKGGSTPKNGSGKQPQKQGWRDRRGQGQSGSSPMPQGSQQQSGSPKPMGSDPMPMGNQSQPLGQGEPKNTGNNPGMGGAKGTPALPLDDTITKHVWGHLPERLRLQMSQYYKEQFMPKYSDMLRQYYTSLADREKAQKKP